MDQFQEDGRHAVARSELISRRIATDNPKNSSLARHVEKPPCEKHTCWGHSCTRICLSNDHPLERTVTRILGSLSSPLQWHIA